MKILTKSALVLILAAIPLSAGHSMPVSIMVISKTIDLSDAIVVGRASILKDNNSMPGHKQVVEVDIDQVLKGDQVQAHHITFDLNQIDAGIRLLDQQYGIFPLRLASNGHYESTDPEFPAMMASPLYSKKKPIAKTVEGAVAIELGWVLETPLNILNDPHSGVHRVDFAPAAEWAGFVEPKADHIPPKEPAAWYGQAMYHDAADLFRDLPFDVVEPVLDRLFTSQQVLTKMWAIFGFLEFGESQYLRAAEPFLKGTDLADDFTRNWLANSIGLLKPSVSDIQVLATLGEAKNVHVCREAVHLLSRIDSSQVIEPLMAYLSNPDADVRYYATNGLAFVTKARPQETPEAFRIDGEDTVRFWTNWARARPQ